MITHPTIRDKSALPDEGRDSVAYWSLVFFTFVVYVAPQGIFPALQPFHLAKVPLALACVTYGFQKILHREPLLPTGPEFRLLAIFVLISILSIPLSLWPGGSAGTFVNLFSKSLIVCLLTAQLLGSLSRFKGMLRFILLFCVLISMIALARYQGGVVVEGYRLQGAFAGMVSNPNDFALTLNLMLPFGLSFFATSKRTSDKLLCATFLLLSIAALVRTFSRGGFITLAVVLVLHTWKNARRMRLRYVFPLLLAVLAFLLFLPEGYGHRVESIIDFSKDKAGSAQARSDDTIRILGVIVENPVLGVGLGMNILALNEKGSYWNQVHNVYLEIASEIGIPGLIVFVWLIIRLVKSLRLIQNRLRQEQGPQELIAFAAATEISLLAFCAAALFHPVAYHFYFYYLAGFAMALKRIAERTDTISTSRETTWPQQTWWQENRRPPIRE